MGKVEWKPGNVLYPTPAVMVSCGTQADANIITVAWTGTVNSDPPMTYISVRPERYSYKKIKENGWFVINLTTKKLVQQCDFCGVRSGAEVDKWKTMGLTPILSKVSSTPMIEESPVNVECKVTQILPFGSHHMFLAEVAAVYADDQYLDADGKFHLDWAEPICYSHGQYYTLGEQIGSFGFSVRKRN